MGFGTSLSFVQVLKRRLFAEIAPVLIMSLAASQAPVQRFYQFGPLCWPRPDLTLPRSVLLFSTQDDWSPFQASLTARQVASLESICRHRGVGSALLQPDLVLSMIQRMALALDRAAQWDSDEGLGVALASHLVGKAKPLPCPEKRQLVDTAITLHSLQLKEGQEVS